MQGYLIQRLLLSPLLRALILKNHYEENSAPTFIFV